MAITREQATIRHTVNAPLDLDLLMQQVKAETGESISSQYVKFAAAWFGGEHRFETRSAGKPIGASFMNTSTRDKGNGNVSSVSPNKPSGGISEDEYAF